MTTPVSRVVHANRLKSYGVGSFVRPAGAGCVQVSFDEGRRTVSAADLKDANGVPLVLRPPYRIVYPKADQ